MKYVVHASEDKTDSKDLYLLQSCQPWAIHICTIISNNPWDLWNILTILTSRTKARLTDNWLPSACAINILNYSLIIVTHTIY